MVIKDLILILVMLNNNILKKIDSIVSFVSSLGFQSHIPLDDTQQEVLLTAFVHKSYASDFVPALSHNERLEFLWDSILGACIGSLLYTKYPQRSEAQMTLYKIALVREETLAQVAREIDLWRHLFLSKGEEKQGGIDKDSILSDSLEALIGAGYLIYGFDQVQQFIYHTIRVHLEEFIQTDCKSYKSLIQEWSQWNWLPLPSYLTTEFNNNGEIWFRSELQINGTSYGSWEGKNKKKSQEEAAKNAYIHKDQQQEKSS